MDTPRYLADGPQDHGHGQCAGEAKEKEYEKAADVLTEVSHEVEGNIEA